jgi:5'-3' exoribonuclease 1
MKLSTDPLWQKTQVILSGHQVPGEGEHKIMEFIRHQKSQPDYNVDTRHCLYGLDADLMMLGLCSHEPLFSLLREEVLTFSLIKLTFSVCTKLVILYSLGEIWRKKE